MAEYVEREAIMPAIQEAVELQGSDYAEAKLAINEIPAADVRPVVRGTWKQNYAISINACSECGYSFSYEGYIAFFNFCPNCGADMRREATP